MKKSISAVFGILVALAGCGDDGGGRMADGGVDDPPEPCVPMAGVEDVTDPDMVDSDCDGFDGDPAAGIFVSLTGEDTNLGTQGSPLRTIDAAIEASETLELPYVYVDAGDYPEQVHLRTGVSLIGGFDSEDGWSRSLDNESVIAAATPAVTGTGLAGGYLEHIRIEAGDAVAGGTSIGLYLHSSTDVLMVGGAVIAGLGGAGADGVPAGGLAGVGQPGGEGVEGEYAALTHSVGQAAGGVGCGICADGGAGAAGSIVNDLSATGGFSEHSGSCMSVSGVMLGTAGADGVNGLNGQHSGGGTFDATGYTPAVGSTGLAGGDGAGGHGGDEGDEGASANCGNFFLVFNPTGGGGGGGGCGGLPGAGAEGGGASIAVFLWDATFATTDVEIGTLGGGAGGGGGDGQLGGHGGTGGLGVTAGGEIACENDPMIILTPADSQAGGAGGAGGDGGTGGGGEGGPSLGVYQGTALAAFAEGAGTTFALGASGAGGAAGIAVAPDGPRVEVVPFIAP